MCGKAVPKSDGTYIRNARLKKLFLQLQKMIRVTDVVAYTAGTDRIEQLEKTIETLQKDLSSYKTCSEISTKKVAQLERKLQRLENKLRMELASKGFVEELIEDVFKGRNPIEEYVDKKYVVEE